LKLVVEMYHKGMVSIWGHDVINSSAYGTDYLLIDNARQ